MRPPLTISINGSKGGRHGVSSMGVAGSLVRVLQTLPAGSTPATSTLFEPGPAAAQTATGPMMQHPGTEPLNAHQHT